MKMQTTKEVFPPKFKERAADLARTALATPQAAEFWSDVNTELERLADARTAVVEPRP